MDVSLDEIIKRNKISNLKNRRRRRPSGQNDKKVSQDGLKTKKAAVSRGGASVAGRGGGGNTGAALKQQGGGVKKKKVTDLRSLIGGKPASRGAGGAVPAPVVRDAREKLNKTPRLSDAREKLLSRSASTLNAELLMRRNRRSSVNARRKLDSRKPAYMDLEEARLKRRSSAGGSLLYRTVDNDAGYLRDFRTGSGGLGRPLHPLASINRPSAAAAAAGAVTPLMPDSWLQPSMQDITRFQPVTRTFSQDDIWTQPQVPRRSTNGMKRRLDREEEPPHIQGYRIVVSNLQPTVTHEDIKELFEDIGSLYNSRVVRPGTAEVMYKNMEDAVKAVDTYHNRQLDGQPMKCLLVKPSNMSRIHSKGSVIPDLHAIHKALFNK